MAPPKTFNFDFGGAESNAEGEGGPMVDLSQFTGPSAEEFMQTLPTDVRNRVYALKGFQKDFNEIHSKLVAEQQALEKKYAALFKPLYEERKQIVLGEREPTEQEIEEGKCEGLEVPDAPAEPGKKGIEDFWFTVLQNNESTCELIEERDTECLKYLRDLTSDTLEEPLQGFNLQFKFAENPYFENEILTKVYIQKEEDGDIILEKAAGCDIKWKQGKNLTVVTKTKKQRQKGGKGKRTISTQEPCDSFFNFFKPPKIPDEDDEDEDDDEDLLEMEEAVEADYEMGRIMAEDVIRKAVDWYTGRCATDEFEDDDEEEEDDEEDEDSDDEPVKPKPKGKKGGKKAGGGEGAKGGKGEPENPECKQQ